MKEVELRLITELMKDSRRSDRELARALLVSQPTITRKRRKLEKEGYIKEYTMIPDWQKLGYQLMAFTLVNMKDCMTTDDAKESGLQYLTDMHNKAPNEAVFFQRGIGANHSGIVVSFHKEYSEYLKLRDFMRGHPFVDPSRVTSFIVDLNDEVQYRSLTFSTIANHLLTLAKKPVLQEVKL